MLVRRECVFLSVGPVGLSAYKRGELWLPYLESHARRIYSAVLHSGFIAARELAKHLLKGDLSNRFSLREIYRKGWAGIGTREDAEDATEILVELNWIRPLPRFRPARTVGQPESQQFEVNPKIRSFREPNIVSSVSDQQGVYGKFEGNTEGGSVSSVSDLSKVCEKAEKSEGEASSVSSDSKKRKDFLTNSVSSVSNTKGVEASGAENLKDPLPPTDRTDRTVSDFGVDL